MRENRCSYLEGFIIMQFQNTTWVPEMAHPTENPLSSSTSQSETDILAKSLDERSQSNNATFATLHHSDRDCVTLSSSLAPSLSHEILPTLPLGPASASLDIFLPSLPCTLLIRKTSSRNYPCPSQQEIISITSPATTALLS